MLAKAIQVAGTAGAVRQEGHARWVVRVDDEQFDVAIVGGRWICSCQPQVHQKRGKWCFHVTVVHVVRHGEPGPVAEPVSFKSDRPPGHRARRRARRQEITGVEKLARELVEAFPEPGERKGPGRPRNSLRSLILALIMWADRKKPLQAVLGMLEEEGWRRVPWLRVPSEGSATEFRLNPHAEPLLEFVQMVSTASAAPHDSIVHFDGTGLQTDSFGAYNEARWPVPGKEHKYLYMMPAVLYETFMAPAASFCLQSGEEPRHFLPILERIQSVFNVRVVGADAGHSGKVNHYYAEKSGFDLHIPFKNGTSPTIEEVNGVAGAYNRSKIRYEAHPGTHLREMLRENNVESFMNAFKERFGHNLRCETEVSLRNEARLRLIAHNLWQWVKLREERGWEPDFKQAFHLVSKAPYWSIDEMIAAFQPHRAVRSIKAGVGLTAKSGPLPNGQKPIWANVWDHPDPKPPAPKRPKKQKATKKKVPRKRRRARQKVDTQLIIDRITAGDKNKQIAEEFGISASRVSQIRGLIGKALRKRHPPLTFEEAERIAEEKGGFIRRKTSNGHIYLYRIKNEWVPGHYEDGEWVPGTSRQKEAEYLGAERVKDHDEASGDV